MATPSELVTKAIMLSSLFITVPYLCLGVGNLVNQGKLTSQLDEILFTLSLIGTFGFSLAILVAWMTVPHFEFKFTDPESKVFVTWQIGIFVLLAYSAYLILKEAFYTIVVYSHVLVPAWIILFLSCLLALYLFNKYFATATDA